MIWILSFFIIQQIEAKPKFISVGFIKEEYLPQPLKIARVKKTSKILGIPQSSVVLKDMQFHDIEEVSLPESRTFQEDLSESPMPTKDKIKKTFLIESTTGTPGHGNFDLKRIADEDL